MFRLILFDIDGTLISTNGAGVKAFAQVCDEIFALPGATDDFSFAGRTDLALVHRIFEQNGIEPSGVNLLKFQDAYLERLPALMPAESHEPLPGVRQWLDELSVLNPAPAIGLLTGNHRRGAEIKLRHYDLWDRFEFGAFGGESTDRDAVARQALAEGQARVAGLQPREIRVVGDTPRDIQCARSIGAKVLAVATGPLGPSELAAHNPDWVADDLTQVRPADLK